MSNPRTLILRTAGINCDVELARAFELAGSDPTPLHLQALIDRPALLEEFDLLGVPGGFSYGDDIAAGRILANRLRHRLAEPLAAFVAAGKPVIGICNGFQVLVKMGLLAATPDAEERQAAAAQNITLADNALPRFVDRWVGLKADPSSPCIWTHGLDEFRLPIAHGEGRFIASDSVLDRLENAGQIALRYLDNPNGSMRDIAGICDPTGVVLGLMPHPERFIHFTNDPQWTRQAPDRAAEQPPQGLKLFLNAVRHVRQARQAVV